MDAAAVLKLEDFFPGDRMSARSVRSFLRSQSAVVLVAESATPHTSHLTPHVSGALVLLFRRNSRMARIYSVVVHPQARGAGIGGRLVDEGEKRARRRGCSAMSLEVRESARAARALYRKRGYRECTRLPDYYEDGAAALRLRKFL